MLNIKRKLVFDSIRRLFQPQKCIFATFSDSTFSTKFRQFVSNFLLDDAAILGNGHPQRQLSL